MGLDAAELGPLLAAVGRPYRRHRTSRRTAVVCLLLYLPNIVET
ncbi:hypothetical protein SAMN04487950_2412 [Halogranum rubrum]|uniref:Uncharacterized protein n=1 Tax=Halogranum rubrum TaxID=553466 RepID=A0A1I4EWB7_9EURY|nr:hypothetical protein [Halogranum rubrum]SFL09400.1 hypothetical protein SAMN04487950_2412 [Halogranum rubrum]